MADPIIPTLDHLETAYAVTRAATQETPLLDAPALAVATGAKRVFVKPESLQRTGSFKFRGAYWRLTRLTDEERARGVVAYSSGNFAQGLAAAGQSLGVPVTIVMPVDAPVMKREATESYGAKVVQSEHGERPREEVASALAKSLAEDEGLVLLHPFDDPEIVAGQAAVGLEALAQLAARDATADLVLCCVGGGGLIGGVSLAFHYKSPGTAVFAVEPVGFDSMGQSLYRDKILRLAPSTTSICDALQSTSPGAATFAAARQAGVMGLAVADAAVKGAMRTSFETLKLVLEPSGAVAVAALLSGQVDVADRTVLVLATGGNIAPEAFFETIAT